MAIAGLLAACSSSSPEKSTTKADFIARADGICSTYDGLAGNAAKNFKHPGARQMVATVERRLVPLYRQRDDELAQLTPPVSDRATVEQFLADLKAATDAVAVDPAAYVATHGATPQARKAAADASAYGFAVCGQI